MYLKPSGVKADRVEVMKDNLKETIGSMLQMFGSLNFDEQVEVFKTIQSELREARTRASQERLAKAEELQIEAKSIYAGTDEIMGQSPALAAKQSY